MKSGVVRCVLHDEPWKIHFVVGEVSKAKVFTTTIVVDKSSMV